MSTAVATLTIVQPGDRVDAILDAIGKVVVPQPQDDGSYRLTFEHASPVSAEPVLNTALKMAGFGDWRDWVALDVEGTPRWLHVQDPLRRRR